MPQETGALMLRRRHQGQGHQRAGGHETKRRDGRHGADPERIGYAIDALLPFWGSKNVADIKGETCRAYEQARGVAPATVRRELGVLRAAINWCAQEGRLTGGAPIVTPPKAPTGRDRYLTREEADRLLVTAQRMPHLWRFIRLGLETGSRSGVLKRLQWERGPAGGWIDLDAGVLYRRPEQAVETKKRATPCRLSPQFVAELETWRDGTPFPIHWRGKQIESVKNAWAEARWRAGLGPEVVPHILRHRHHVGHSERRAAVGRLGLFRCNHAGIGADLLPSLAHRWRSGLALGICFRSYFPSMSKAEEG